MKHEREVAEALPTAQRKLMCLLMNGGKYSVADICRKLDLADPRGHIRFLRNKGFRILDEWRDTGFNRFKVYFYKPDEQ